MWETVHATRVFVDDALSERINEQRWIRYQLTLIFIETL